MVVHTNMATISPPANGHSGPDDDFGQLATCHNNKLFFSHFENFTVMFKGRHCSCNKQLLVMSYNNSESNLTGMW